MLDNVDMNLVDAVGYLEKAETNLETAKKIHQSTNKKLMCMMVCMVIAGVVLV
eukprot:CAMPEP_0176343092 /NCGR_PEP_ID=MMETSP0126-20121128/3679_1 /TAXON_ID=141414 ORGANISM="Strombidinopsis acuminatum, Strain SPMC142" /NCGR_SAMPLE_ID=MMETSP0126 /ASSEMBLY_ACC=CAM_ASM_000229 /LENGTH=52 /DNA_ID=CAMNT_0017688857 /DNA_START=540 /DNA_END=694 /DNA_ORIENTATION=+